MRRIILACLVLAWGACGSSPPPPPQETVTAPPKRAVGATCDLASECASGICEGQGCGTNEGVCGATDRMCTRDLRPYCGCDGQMFNASGNCPGKRYSARGACPTK